MSDSSPKGSVVAVLNDLIFGTKIRSTAESLHIAAILVRSSDELARRLDADRPSLILVDLNTTLGAPISAITAARRHPARPYIVAFVSHVDRDLADRAAAAGADEVMPRSRFTMQLPQLLQDYCTGPAV